MQTLELYNVQTGKLLMMCHACTFEPKPQETSFVKCLECIKVTTKETINKIGVKVVIDSDESKAIIFYDKYKLANYIYTNALEQYKKDENYEYIEFLEIVKKRKYSIVRGARK